MTQKTIKIFINQTYCKSPNYATNKTDVYHIDDIWNLEILDLKDYGVANYRFYRYVLVALKNLSKFCLTVLLENKNGQTIKDSLEKNLLISGKKTILVEIDRGIKFYNNFFQNFLNNIIIEHYFRNTTLRAVFAERFYRTIKDLLKRPVFGR